MDNKQFSAVLKLLIQMISIQKATAEVLMSFVAKDDEELKDAQVLFQNSFDKMDHQIKAFLLPDFLNLDDLPDGIRPPSEP